jgi:hypothetical protein
VPARQIVPAVIRPVGAVLAEQNDDSAPSLTA